MHISVKSIGKWFVTEIFVEPIMNSESKERKTDKNFTVGFQDTSSCAGRCLFPGAVLVGGKLNYWKFQ